MPHTTGTYQALTIVSLLVGAGLLIWMVVLYTQNTAKLGIVDTFANTLQGPVSRLAIGDPEPGNALVSRSMSMRNLTGGIEQLGIYLNTPTSVTFSTPAGRVQRTLS